MATKNTRMAALYLGSTLGGTYTRITKTHGLNLSVPTDFSEDTGHGERFKSYLPGLQDFEATISAWYDTANTVLESLSINKTSEYFLIYPDYTDVTNYYRGQMYVGLQGFDLSIGQTAGHEFVGRIANADIQIVRAGSAL